MLKGMDLLGFIVRHAEGDEVIRLAAKSGIKGGTVFKGEGTARSGILRKLGMDIIKRDLVLIVAPSAVAKKAMNDVAEKKQLDKKNKGISFRLPLNKVLGVVKEEKTETYEKEQTGMYQAIFVIVDEGESDRVLEAANEAGSQGGTVIHAHGSGGKETKRVFKMEIEPAKDIVLILSRDEITDGITRAINKEMNLEEPNAGILFTTDLSETRGIF